MFSVLTMLFLMCGSGTEISAKNIDLIYDPTFKSFLREFCPEVNACHSNASQMLRFLGGPCCTECSCSKDCAETTGNCCFPTENTIDLQAECLFPSTELPNEDKRIKYQTYSMISGSPENATPQERGSVSETCGKEKVAPWGSFYPVFSLQDRRIYKNMACAKAHNVTDVIMWKAYLFCSSKGMKKVSNVALEFLYDLDYERGCRIDFSYPGNKDDLQFSKCYENMIDSCEMSNFTVSPAMTFDHEKIVEACESGFLSPFRHYKLYANVFCYVCNGGILDQQITCDGVQDIVGRHSSFGSFLALLNIDFTVLEDDKYREDKACRIENESIDTSNCRPVHCPMGMKRRQRGDCQFLVKEVYKQPYLIHLKLTTLQFIDFEKVFSTADSADQVWSFFETPWPKDWELELTFFETAITSQMSKLIVSLKTKQEITNLKKLINTIKNLIKKPWFLKVGDTKITLQSDIFEKQILEAGASLERSTSFQLENRNVSFDFPSYKPLFEPEYFSRSNFQITRTFFCEQVELKPFEFQLSYDKSILLNFLTNMFVFDADFTLIKNADGLISAKVCIQDSGFKKVKSSSSNASNHLLVPTVWNFLLFQLTFFCYV